MNRRLLASMRAFDHESDRIAEREEGHFAEHGRYSSCAGCGEECNPSNVHADGRKFCDDCWEQSDDFGNDGGPDAYDMKGIHLHEKIERQMVVPVKRHSGREKFMRYAEKEAIKNPVVSGCSSQTYQMFMRWYGQDLHKTLSETLSRRRFVHENWDALKALVTVELRGGHGSRCPKRLRERCSVDDIMSRFNNWNSNSHTDNSALEYFHVLRNALLQINSGEAGICVHCAKSFDDCVCLANRHQP